MRAVVIAVAVTALVLTGTGAGAGPASAAVPSLRVLAPPEPVLGTDERRHLAYEVLAVNETASRLRIERVDVLDPSRATPLARYRGAAVEDVLVGADAAPTRTLPPGELGVLVLDVTLPPGQPVPARLAHRVVAAESGGTARRAPVGVTGARTRVRRRAPLRLGLPVRGRDLAVFGCCGRPFAHRLALLEFGGRPFLAQRFAIDFVRTDGATATFAGDPARNESYLVYGAPVVAAARGRVVAARDGVPDNVPPGLPPAPGVDALTGNFVTQDLGNGRFALYAHLRPGSVRVRPGQVVRRGQRLGLVGNTGNSSEPHLHFHVMDGPGGSSSLAADGVPYVFDRFRITGRIGGLAAEPAAPVLEPPPTRRARKARYPLTGDVLALP